MTGRTLALALFCSALALPVVVPAQSADPVRARVTQERAAFLDTLRDLVSIESGSGDVDDSLETLAS